MAEEIDLVGSVTSVYHHKFVARKSEQELVQFLLGNTNGMFRKFPPATFDVILFAVNGYFMVCVRQHSAKIRGWNSLFLRKNDKREIECEFYLGVVGVDRFMWLCLLIFLQIFDFVCIRGDL